jgi:hypothetical protein
MQTRTHFVLSVQLFSIEVHENPFRGGRATACRQTGKVQHISASSNAMLSHKHTLPVLITYFHNKLFRLSPNSTIPLLSKPLNNYEHRSFPSTSHLSITVSYVPAHLLPSFPITYFRMASSSKLWLHFLIHYLNNTRYGTPWTSAVWLRSLPPFASYGMWKGRWVFRSVCVWRQRLKVKVAKRAFPPTKHPHRNINLYIRPCLVRMFCYNAR